MNNSQQNLVKQAEKIIENYSKKIMNENGKETYKTFIPAALFLILAGIALSILIK